MARRAACSLLQPRLRAARLRSEGHAPAARRELLASPGLPAAAPKPGSGVARGPLQAWGCSPWSSATATWTARGSGRGSAPTKRSSRGPTSSSRSSSRTGRASSRRPRVSGDLGRAGCGAARPGGASPEGHGQPVLGVSCRRNRGRLQTARPGGHSSPAPQAAGGEHPSRPCSPAAAGTGRRARSPSPPPSAAPLDPPQVRFYCSLKLLTKQKHQIYQFCLVIPQKNFPGII